MDNWEDGSRGWIIWISLGSLLADASVKLTWFIVRPLWTEYSQRFHGSGNRAQSVNSHTSQDDVTDQAPLLSTRTAPLGPHNSSGNLPRLFAWHISTTSCKSLDVIITASGLILGESLASLVAIALTAFHVLKLFHG